MEETFIILAVLAGITAIVLGGYHLVMRSYAANLRPLAGPLGGTVRIPYLVSNPVLEFNHGGEKAKITLAPPDRYRPSALLLSLAGGEDFTFTIEGGSVFIRVLSIPLWGPMRIKTGAPALDANFVVRASDESRAGFFFQDTDRVQAIIEIMNSGCEKIENKKSVLTAKRPYRYVTGSLNEKLGIFGKGLIKGITGFSTRGVMSEDLNPQTITRYFDLLAKLTERKI